MATPLYLTLEQQQERVGVTSLESLAQEAVSAQFYFLPSFRALPYGFSSPCPISLLESILCTEEIVGSEKYWFKP